MLSIVTLSDAKPLRTFAGNVLYCRIVLRKTASHFCWKCSLLPHCPTQNRFALLLEMLSIAALSCAKPLRTFAGNALRTSMHTIGVISDTHGLLREEAVCLLRGVDHIIHA